MPIASSSARTVASSVRTSFGRSKTIYDAWHYVPVLARSPVPLRNGAPSRMLPAAMERIRRKLADPDDDDLQIVSIVKAVIKGSKLL